MSVKIKVATYQENPMLVISGEIICQESIKISNALQGYLHSECTQVILNLNEVTFIDSYGLGGLIYSKKLFDREGKKLMLLDLGVLIKKIFERNNLDRAFTILNSQEGAQ